MGNKITVDAKEYERLKRFATPRKPAEDDLCPNCGHIARITSYWCVEYYADYCPNCGQAIDWS